MILKWKKENVNYVELALSEEDRKAGKKLPERGHLTLLPGVNEIDDAEWPFVEPHVQHHVKSGNLEIVDQTSALHKLNSNDARAFLKSTVSADTLNRWLVNEERPDIRNRIRERMKELKIDELDVVEQTPVEESTPKEKSRKAKSDE